ncbi:MAG: tetratricopeptide repeat protein [Candidatus Omnitrophota bacterium]
MNAILRASSEKVRALFSRVEFWFALLVLAVYANCIPGAFVWEDEQLIVKNVFLTHWKFLPDLLTKNAVAGAGMPSNFFRPFPALTHFLDSHLWGSQAWGHHLTNLFLVLGMSLAVLKLFRSLFSPRIAGAFAALFCVHPLLSELVAYVSGRNDLLAILFLCVGLLTYSKRPWLAVLCHILAMTSKESLALFPVFLWIYQKMRCEKIVWLRLLPFVLISAGYMALRLTVLNFGSTLNFYQHSNIFTEHFIYRLYTYLTTLPKALALWVAPYDLHHERSWKVFVDLRLFQVWGSALLLVVTAFALWLGRRKYPKAVWGGLWFLVATLPTSNLLIPINAIFYDHWFILPGLGLVIMLADFAQPLEETKGVGRPLGRIFFITILAALAVLTVLNNGRWATNEKLYRHILYWEPGSAKITSNYAMALDDSGKPEAAIEYYRKAIAISDEFPQTHHNMGMSYLKLSKFWEALAEYDQAIRMDPNFYQSWFQKGLVLAHLGQFPKAREALEKALAIYSYEERIYLNLAAVLCQIREGKEAREVLEKGRQALPGSIRIQKFLSELSSQP